MKNPNGYGNITKLPGNRRNPWRVRKTDGWKWYDRLTKTTTDALPDDCNVFELLSDGKMRYTEKQVFINIGYYPTRQDAMIALAEYNKDPFDLNLASITFGEVYDKWSDIHFEKIKDTNGYKAAYKLCSKLDRMRMVDIKLDHLQTVVDESGKNTPTLKTLKNMWGLMWDYCVKHEILPQEKREMVRYVDISKPGNPNAYDRKPFTKKDVAKLWKIVDSNEYYMLILMLIYTGLRIGEFLDLKKSEVNMEERWFKVLESKTNAGIRTVPIAEKVYPFFEYWMNKNDCEYLVSTPDGKHFVYRNYYDSYWKPLINAANITFAYTPHCTRHTCVSLLTAAKVDERFIQKIVGHKGQNVTQVVYTHLEIQELIDEINKI